MAGNRITSPEINRVEATTQPSYRVLAEDESLSGLNLANGVDTSVDTESGPVHVEAMRIMQDTAAKIAAVIVETLTDWESELAPHGQIIALGETFNGVSIVDVISEIRALEGLQYGAPIAFVGDLESLSPEQLRAIQKRITHQLDQLTEASIQTLAEAEDKRRRFLQAYATNFTSQSKGLWDEWRNTVEYTGDDEFTKELITEITTALGRLVIYLDSFGKGTYANKTNDAIHDINNLLMSLIPNSQLLAEVGFNPNQIISKTTSFANNIAARGDELRPAARQIATISQRIFEFQASRLESLADKNIVIIDDNRTNTRILAEWARKNGAASVTIAHSQKEVAGINAEMQNADIIICDHNIADDYTGAHVFAEYQDQLKANNRFIIHTDDETVINNPGSVYSGDLNKVTTASKFLVGDFEKALT